MILERGQLDKALAPLLDLLAVDARDVLSVRVGLREVTVRTVVRGKRRVVVENKVVSTRYRVTAR